MEGLDQLEGSLAVVMLGILALGLAGSVIFILARWNSRRRRADGSALAALHSVAETLPFLTEGLDPAKSDKCATRLAKMLGVNAVAIADEKRIVGSTGLTGRDLERTAEALSRTEVSRRPAVHHHRQQSAAGCSDPSCIGQDHASIGLYLEGQQLGAVRVFTDDANRRLVQAVGEAAALFEAQLAVREVRRARGLQTEAELESLRAQISPHFIYNALNVIASFISSDPERARALIVDFAKYTRYSFRRSGPFTPLSDELKAIESYLALQKARYGSRLRVNLEISPESLSTRIPYLSLQPLVENAVRHGIEAKEGEGHISISAHDEGAVTVVAIEDDGAGMDSERLRAALSGELEGHHVGLRNVDTRMRQTYGEAFGLVVETGLGAGTLITLRIPKFNLPPTL